MSGTRWRDAVRIGSVAGPASAAATLVAALLAAAGSEWTGFRAAEARGGDLLVRLERAVGGSTPADSSIVIIDIDNRSLDVYEADLGRWPWPRNAHAAILDYVQLGDPRSVAFDILFSEPDLTRPAADSVFVAAHDGPGRVIHAAFFFHGPRSPDALDSGLERFALPDVDVTAGLPSFAAVDAPLGSILRRADGLGAITRTPDPDGVSRLEPFAVRIQDRAFPSLGLAVVGLARESEVPLVEGRVQLRWRGSYAERPYRVVPAFDVLNSYVQTSVGEVPDLDPEVFAGKDVIVGSSAAGVGDLFPTPFGPNEPGVLVHATLVDTIRTADAIRPLGGWWVVAIVVLVSVLAAMGVAWIGSPAWGAAGLAIGLVGGWSLAVTLLRTEDWLVPVALPSIAAFLAAAGAVGGNYLIEGRRHREIRDAFGKFVPARVVEMIAARPGRAYDRIDRRVVTVLFCDVRGFTTLSERLDARAIVAQLNELLAALVEVVFEHHGTLDKFLGDGLMAFFGAPREDPDHALHAVRSAARMLDRVDALNHGWQAAGRPRLEIGIGIHTGEAVVGFVGDPTLRMDYTAIGDTVNLASRLEGLTKDTGAAVVLSEATRERLDDAVTTRSLGETRVKGRATPVAIHALESV